jgi:hypothetical protein
LQQKVFKLLKNIKKRNKKSAVPKFQVRPMNFMENAPQRISAGSRAAYGQGPQALLFPPVRSGQGQGQKKSTLVSVASLRPYRLLGSQPSP